MPRKLSKRSTSVIKPKRLTAAQLRVGMSVVDVKVDTSNMPAYKSQPSRTRRSMSVGAVPGTGKRAAARKKHGGK